ncbi:uncharacterized protein LOC141852027 [Brevipalpus obovatus]|uniref:uncharacterized protein LOC141852027 n=1 Tax=Brevipalpus obovatus TaxID=246614 RepID=UPI003D9F9586
MRLVTKEFLKNEIITNIRIQFSDVTRVPDVSVCLYFYNFVSFAKLKTYQPRIFTRLKQNFPHVNNQSAFNEWKFSSKAIDFLTKELSKLTISQMMSTMFETGELIVKIEPTVRQRDKVDKVTTREVNDCSFRTNIKEPYICFTIHCPVLQVNLLQQKDLELAELIGTVLAVYFQHSLFATTEEYYIYLHPAGTLPYGSQMSSVTIVTEENSHKFYIEYKVFEATLLPPPFSTNCKEYKPIGYKSQKHALEICRNKLSEKIFGCGFYSDVVDSKSPYKLAIGDYYIHYDDPKRRRIINEIYDNCSREFASPDCKQEYFVPRIQKVARIDSNYTILYLSMPTEPDIINTCNAKMPLFEYLIYIGSIFGTWFGFNVLGSSPEIVQWVVTFLRILVSPLPNQFMGNSLQSGPPFPLRRRNTPVAWEIKHSAHYPSKAQPTLPRVITWEEYLR